MINTKGGEQRRLVWFFVFLFISGHLNFTGLVMWVLRECAHNNLRIDRSGQTVVKYKKSAGTMNLIQRERVVILFVLVLRIYVVVANHIDHFSGSRLMPLLLRRNINFSTCFRNLKENTSFVINRFKRHFYTSISFVFLAAIAKETLMTHVINTQETHF